MKIIGIAAIFLAVTMTAANAAELVKPVSTVDTDYAAIVTYLEDKNLLAGDNVRLEKELEDMFAPGNPGAYEALSIQLYALGYMDASEFVFRRFAEV